MPCIAAIMQSLEWSDYQAFLAIARARQLRRAAGLMKVDPTTLGRRLRRLEERLGKTLFEKTREGLILSTDGEQLLDAVEAMAMAASRIDESVRGGAGPSGTLRVSVAEGFGSWFLAEHVGGFCQTYPNLTLDLAASSGFLSPSKREADVAVMLSRPKTGPILALKLSDYTLGVYASRAYLDRAGTPENTEALLNGHNLVGYIPDLLYAPELNYLDEIRPGLSPVIRSSSITAQYRVLTNGAGLGVLPYFMARGDRRLVRILPSITITRSLWIITHQDTNRLARVRLFNEWLRQLVRANQSSLIDRTS